ncbi:MAG: bifunctional UDP-N-acetylglucosamine diphosphorylase/glucosamine-1-phosphate N-acetyltransferase GlmU [Natronospirillum sp.]|uniref:bifunctional UDP-N-acetylglucosamine diphosphorylase/glucosamine-1-phosphate N-acetyltransferase GlmU n=1 Tax=Natronospirillum sp. TaxID=2812955 RepID=UPI0025E743CA|nr:bifunctional UDP-N-acetylglucosamine diphosphorylase/glucosamine-1-phosphate N-acetyltransferase GlmU [Natronospirillum sp.]MCH8551690.1 bifunctional UDP-N-acetylglucosamine diphosphorylase/glucosamine-1-phosphate N-acetyltransferase GlmU [Natronospirillum sp.]
MTDLTTPVHIVILAAGQGSRMKSELPKVCHPIAGEAMIRHVVRTGAELGQRITVVVGHGADTVKAELADHAGNVQFVHQTEQLGTGHAVMQALPHIQPEERVLVLYGDVPLITTATLQPLLVQEQAQALTLLTATLYDPTGYGRILRAGDAITGIVEQKDASADQQAIREVNTGFVAVPGERLHDWLPRLSNDNAQGEYYLTDLVALAVADGVPVTAVQPLDVGETMGVNNRVQLAALERRCQQQRAEQLMLAGVTLADPQRTDLRREVQVGPDCFIDVNAVLDNVRIGPGVHIGPHCVLRDVEVGAGTVIESHSVLDNAVVGEQCQVGPFARLRPQARLEKGAKVGNFVEVKKATLEAGAKVSHLTYIGDARVGAGANVGAGTITCNYDGANKYHTDIGAGAFIGSNSTLVAPVEIEDGAFIGAGSVITKSAPADQLTLSRSRQTTIRNWRRPEKKKP